ncbi:MAG: DEAD/DEAH box helicase [Methylophaga sp.]|nr:DEAD/DEAH box helicase [Methylophaga sp.]
MTFSNLSLADPILRALEKAGYASPSPIQQAVIPEILAGKDVMAAAQTGTGKTAGFTLPILQRLSLGQKAAPNQARCLILTPTRELAAQVGESVARYGQFLPLRSAVVFGGVGINPQMMKLRKGVDILVATPGRLLDLYGQNAVRFNHLEILVLDEADRMLDMGFIHDIRKIQALLPAKRQTLLFSATFSTEIRELARRFMDAPAEISVSPANTTASTVKQWISPVDKKQKPAVLAHLIKQNNWYQVLVFSRTKHGANKLSQHLDQQGIKAAAIHGNKSQSARTKALADFKAGKIQVLVATDIAARGLDIDQLPHVINVDLPNVPEDYVHRIGRTGRAGADGEAISLVSADEIDQLNAIERVIGKQLQRILVDGFEPVHDLPASKSISQPQKPSRPRTQHRDGQRAETAHGNKTRHRQRPSSAAPSANSKPARRRRRPSSEKS